MTDLELAAIHEALHESHAALRSVGPDEPGSSEAQQTAIEKLGVALELLTGVVYRLSKR